METKTLKIEVPKGYEIDKEKSTFENIVFKKVNDVEIKWNKNYNGVEIKANGEHFILDSNPSYCMSWNDATRFYNSKHRSHTWNLPTVEQLQVMSKYYDRINNVIKDNGGFVLLKGFYWSMEEEDEFCALHIHMAYYNTVSSTKGSEVYVRAVSTL